MQDNSPNIRQKHLSKVSVRNISQECLFKYMDNRKIPRAPAIASVLALAIVILSLSNSSANADALKGGVQENTAGQGNAGVPTEPLPVPVLPPTKLGAEKGGEDNGDSLKGKSESDMLNGQEQAGDDGLQGQTGKTGDQGPLKAGTQMQDAQASDDPDGQDQDLQVEWDRWRNRFLRAVLAGATEFINNPDEVKLRWDPQRRAMVPALPMGIESWFSCNITKNRKITDLRIEQSSGFANYDRAVMNSVKSLENTSILRFPERSHRQVVSQSAGIKTSPHTENRYFKFGDVEHYRVPSN
jgi:hypothetical protein